MKKGLLLINLGTPAKANYFAVLRYLNAFLKDKRIIDLPLILRYALLYCFILPFRTVKTTKAYRAIWLKHGSPLLHLSLELTNELITKLKSTHVVALGMRYGQPSIAAALKTLKTCDEIIVLPLYPQYASAAAGSALEQVLNIIKNWEVIPKLTVIPHFYNHPAYIQAKSNHIKHWLESYDHILFSYHSLPKRQLLTQCQKLCSRDCHSTTHTNCYRAQCFETSKQLISALSINPSQVTTAFQSKLGKTPWITPYTEDVLIQLANLGVKKLLVVCPSFVVDCLETLEEINIRARKQWFDLTGKQLTLVPGLNASKLWVNAISTIIT